MLLEIKNVHVHYHKVAALKGINMSVPEDGIVTIIGANGAGKSTTLRAISGLERISKGEIWFSGERIDKLQPEQIVARGIGHVPEGRRVFPDLTVEENLMTGSFLRSNKAEIAEDLDQVYYRFPRLKERRKKSARTLSGGEQQMLAIGRALMSRPKMLVLDEPSMGLSPVMVQEVARIIRDIVDRGVPVVLVEQNAELALRLARFAYVLETGNIALQGPAHELHDNEHVRAGLSRWLNSWSFQELLDAGWSEADLAWEAAAERTAEAVAQNDLDLAKEEAGKALRLARASFEPIDPRLGTSFANFGVCLALAGDNSGTDRLFADALEVWRRADPWIARMDAPRIARSSLFHMRMEMRHRDTYRARWRERWLELTQEARERLRGA